ncbi:MAG: hypothetical protein ACFFD8_01170 [Candidatus Thorarchaeota archaeon]
MPKPLYKGHAQSLDGRLSWDVIIPKFSLGTPRRRRVSFQIQFLMKNNSEAPLIVHTQIQSLTETLRFQFVKVTTLGKNRVSEEREIRTGAIKRKLRPHQEIALHFFAKYHSQLSHQNSLDLGLEYIISAFDVNGKIISHSDPYQIVIPLTRRI